MDQLLHGHDNAELSREALLQIREVLDAAITYHQNEEARYMLQRTWCQRLLDAPRKSRKGKGK